MEVAAEPKTEEKELPQKRYFRQRAHCNPLANNEFDHPVSPNHIDWKVFYPAYPSQPGLVEFADVGCGYGGLLMNLATMFPEKLMMGMEIRQKVSAYVRQKIEALRTLHPGQYQNISVVQTNAMKYLPNYFRKAQLSKMFFLFPDPHFKKSKQKWRIVSPTLISEYAFALREGGIVYTITDVEEVHIWMAKHFQEHRLFRRLSAEEMATDPVVEKLWDSTEEGKKVTRNGGQKFCACFERIPSAS
ncbi:tRNA (guanine-N(7)-)-methyltransferase [Hypsibius exemplaris]|uniref:tRNA (guanine-N(7)-)-methyltransferase n=1 Tax=Hypsibius exemplaris TaxID=2072580 RepID=A0A1W0W9T2_HYPEX|nr:tRNA (guanine-N(7)-)-methyltransferase [Hypsibius exemplaris]